MLSIKTFDGLEVRKNGALCLRRLGPVCRELLAYMVVNPNQQIRREKLIDIHYPNSTVSQSSKAFNMAIGRIKTSLKSSKIENVKIHNGGPDIVFEIDTEFSLDSVFLENSFDRIKANDEMDLKAAQKAVSIYQGPFLSGMDKEWIYFEREKYHSMCTQLLYDIAHTHLERGHYTRAAQAANEILEIDPFREYVHHFLMVCFCLSGQRVRAIKQFREYSRILNEELAFEPLNELADLFAKIRNGEAVSKNHLVH